MSCDCSNQALELLEDCQQKLKEIAKVLKTEQKDAPVYESPCMDLYKDRVLLKITEAGAMCGLSRSAAYQMLYNGEWKKIAIRLSERSIRIPMKSLMEWIDNKRVE